MRIQIDHVVRDMTPEEEAEYLSQSDELPDSEALDILMGVSE